MVGVGMTPFRKPGRDEIDYPEMVREAGKKALDDAGVAYNAIEQAVVGYVYGDSTCGQRGVYELGLTGIPISNVNNNCSTGSTALFLARQLVQGGLADCVLALGFEKMQPGSLTAQFGDREQPLMRHLVALSELYELTAAPMAAQMFADAVDKGTAGRVRVQVFHSGQVANDAKSLEQLQIGGLDLFPADPVRDALLERRPRERPPPLLPLHRLGATEPLGASG